MTTIAYRDGVIAADTLACMGDNSVGYVIKIARNSNGDLAGAAGLASYNYAFLKWFTGMESGEVPKAVQDDRNFDRGIIVRKTGRVEIYEPTGMHIMTAPYFAIGSGKPEALGAMAFGAGAAEAVKAAMQHDLGTGGDITVLRHEQ